jgi:glycosyltransferase involved in cell wall biosynthesis
MISVLIIAKNEEDVIEDAIKSVQDLADEVVVVDGGSTDKTVDISQKLGAKILRNKFRDFSDQRNLAASVAKGDILFYLDADERATPKFINELKQRLELEPETAGYFVSRKTFYYGKDWHFEDRVQRLFRKDKLKEWYGVVHETPKVDGKLENILEPILHFTHRNFEQMIAKTNEWSEYEAELRLKANHPKMNVLRFVRVIITAFLGSYFSGGGWRNGSAGVVEAIYQSYSMFITYAKLWEMQEASK